MSLDRVPYEIVQQILRYIPPLDTLLTLQRLSRRFLQHVQEPLLWRFYCLSSFKYWHPRHNLQRKLQCYVSDVDWKQLFILRTQQNRLAADLLDAIITMRVGRLKRFERIARLGYDAKEYLIDQCRTNESVGDVLARRYYSNSLLDSIHRSIAIEEWRKLSLDSDSENAHVAGVCLERALGAFDMFVLHDEYGDLDEISQMLDKRAAEFRQSEPNLGEFTTRQKALALNRWLRLHRLTGMSSPADSYRNLRNVLIGQALRHDDHESIPLVSSAIFCCLAARLGLTAQCCAFPGHVHAIVFANPDSTLDGIPLQKIDRPQERMYLDPFGLDDEVPTARLQELLASLGWHTSTDVFFAPVSSLLIVLRAARNIKATFARVLELQDEPPPQLSQLLRGNSSMNMEAALYSSMWAPLMLMAPNTFEWDDCLVSFLRRFAHSWPEDAWLVEEYLMPLFNGYVPQSNRLDRNANRLIHDPGRLLQYVRRQDESVDPSTRRSDLLDELIPFKIGQVFRHRRYGWMGAITGWADLSARGEGTRRVAPLGEQIEQNVPPARPSTAVRASSQYFYMCIPSTGAEHHTVATENIELIDDASLISDDMFPLAGRFFKRFDRATCTFVSNLREQYPDD